MKLSETGKSNLNDFIYGGVIIKILLVTDIDNPGLKEDCFIAKAFIKDSHHVTITRWDYDEVLDDLYDVVILRNIWHLDSKNFLDYKNQLLSLKQRLKRKKIPTINLFSRFDDNGKLYLKELYEKGYPVIPTSTDMKLFEKYPENSMFCLKMINGYDGYGQCMKVKDEVIENSNYIIQPKIDFIKEVEFYFINKQFQYALEFVPSKKPVYPIPKLYDYTDEELEVASCFANMCQEEFVGVQRIDFLKTMDNQLLLLEIGDSAPYLNLNSLDKDTRDTFLKNYKKVVYEYLQRNNIEM